MSDIGDKRLEELEEELRANENIADGPDDSGRTDPECWRRTVISAALEEAIRIVTQASMRYDEQHGEMNDAMHPMDAVAPDNVANVYATSRPWRIPVFVLELEERPAYIPEPITENKEVYARRLPGRSHEPTYVRIQIRGGR